MFSKLVTNLTNTLVWHIVTDDKWFITTQSSILYLVYFHYTGAKWNTCFNWTDGGDKLRFYLIVLLPINIKGIGCEFWRLTWARLLGTIHGFITGQCPVSLVGIYGMWCCVRSIITCFTNLIKTTFLTPTRVHSVQMKWQQNFYQ